MKEEVGLADKYVIWLDIAGFAGGILSSYIWGWAADRFGSKPVMLLGPILNMLFPIVCFLIPRHQRYSVLPAVLVPFIIGAAGMAWNIGLGRYLYVTLVPPAKKTAYTAVYYASFNLAAGFGIIASGYLVKLTQFLRDKHHLINDPYLPIFVFGMLIAMAGMLVLSRLANATDMPFGSFLAMFIKGNPLRACWGLIWHKTATREKLRIRILHSLGHSRSPLSHRELIAGLNDPSGNVVEDAIIALAHYPPAPDLVAALEELIRSRPGPLGAQAAWALSRMGAVAAIPALRLALVAEDGGLRAAAARSLGILGDTAGIEILADRLAQEPLAQNQPAFAWALGRLGAGEHLDAILQVLGQAQNNAQRQEAALAAAQLIGDEGDYIKLWRKINHDFATAMAQTLWSLKKPLARFSQVDFDGQIDAAAAAFAENNAVAGTPLLVNLGFDVAKLSPNTTSAAALNWCLGQLSSLADPPREYFILTLFALQGISKEKQLPSAPPEKSQQTGARVTSTPH